MTTLVLFLSCLLARLPSDLCGLWFEVERGLWIEEEQLHNHVCLQTKYGESLSRIFSTRRKEKKQARETNKKKNGSKQQEQEEQGMEELLACEQDQGHDSAAIDAAISTFIQQVSE